MPYIENFEEANKYLSGFYENIRRDSGYSLNNMRELMDYLDNPQEKFKVIHVAGTSGKTSTSYYMASLLNASGRKVGLTVSPHIDSMSERVQIGGAPISEEDFCNGLSEFSNLVELASVKPTWFEIMVAFAYWYFAKVDVDYAVVEVGLGGLKDGTNVIKRSDKICIITDISYDHMDVLGNTLSQIAAQKAGIIHLGNEVFCYKQSPEILKVIENSAEAQKAHLKELNEVENAHEYMPDYQFRNWNLALHVYGFLCHRDELPKLSDEALEETQHLVVPGRMDALELDGKLIIMDGAHNVQKITAMIESFQKLYPDIKPAVLVGLKKGKDYKEVASLLSGIASRVITTGFESSQDLPINSIDSDQLAEAFKDAGMKNVKSHPYQSVAVRDLLNGPEKICLITGSLYLVGQLRKRTLLEVKH